jgi:two-component system LytT family response regulator
MTIRVLIVDDEPMPRQRLERLLRDQPDLELLTSCGDGRSAVAAILEQRPDLLFLDVQMPEMNGFDVLAAVGARQMPVVIFVTAFDRFALQAFEAQALDYLLKPFGAERVEQALDRARTFLAGGRRKLEARFDALLEQTAEAREGACLLVRKRERTLVLRADEIDFVEACGDYVKLHVARETHLLRATLADTERRLRSSGFVRIHRSRLVNWARVREFVADADHDPQVVLQNGVKVPASAGYLRELQQKLAPLR